MVNPDCPLDWFWRVLKHASGVSVASHEALGTVSGLAPSSLPLPACALFSGHHEGSSFAFSPYVFTLETAD